MKNTDTQETGGVKVKGKNDGVQNKLKQNADSGEGTGASGVVIRQGK